MGRLIGDGALYWYLQDLLILTAFQLQGIGTAIVRRLLEHIKKNSIPGSITSVYLKSARGKKDSQGKEGFYEHFGFTNRPHE